MKTSKLALFSALFTLAVVGCGDDGSGDSGDSGNSTSATSGGSSGGSTAGSTAGSTTGTPGACPGVNADAAAGEGDPCTSNDDCNTGVCLLYRDVPAPTDAVCGPMPADCSTRITGTVLDFETGQPVAGVTVDVAKALEAATNPTGFTPILSLTSDADGRVDGTTPGPLDVGIGIVSMASASGYYLTATGIASPVDGTKYAPGTGIHDLWVMPEASLTAWSSELGNDAEMQPFMPLGDQGGVVGFIRDESTGAGVAGAVVKSVSDTSTAKIRYLNDDGMTFNATASSSNGIFVLVAPGLAEEFFVEKDGATISTANGTAGSASGAIFTLVIDVQP